MYTSGNCSAVTVEIRGAANPEAIDKEAVEAAMRFFGDPANFPQLKFSIDPYIAHPDVWADSRIIRWQADVTVRLVHEGVRG